MSRAQNFFCLSVKDYRSGRSVECDILHSLASDAWLPSTASSVARPADKHQGRHSRSLLRSVSSAGDETPLHHFSSRTGIRD